jgi:hypothetical protein
LYGENVTCTGSGRLVFGDIPYVVVVLEYRSRMEKSHMAFYHRPDGINWDSKKKESDLFQA